MRGLLPLPVLALVFLTLVEGTGEFIIMGILPDIAEGLDVEYTMVGALVSVFALSYGIAAPLLSNIAGKYNLYRIVIVLTVGFLVSDIWSMLATGYVSLMLSRVMTAAVSGALFSVTLTCVVEMVDQTHRAGSLAWMYAGFNISSILGVPLGTYVCHSFGWRSAFLMIAFLIVAALLMVVRTLPRSIRVEQAGRGSSDSKGLLKDPRTIMAFALTTFVFGGSYMIFTYITPILEDVIGLSPASVGIGLAMFGLMCFISNLTAGKLSNMGGLLLGRYVFVLQMVVFLLFPLALTNSVTGFIFLMAIGFLMYIMNASIQIIFVDVASKDYPGSLALASALNPTAFSVGIMTGSFIAGLIYDAVGPQFLGFGGAAYFVAAVVVSFTLVHYCRKSGRQTSVT